MPRPLIWPVRAWPPWAGAAAVVLGLHLVVLVWVAGRTPPRPALPTWPTAWVQVRLAPGAPAAQAAARRPAAAVSPAQGRPPAAAQALWGGDLPAGSLSPSPSPDATRRPEAPPAAGAGPAQTHAPTQKKTQAFPGGEHDTHADAGASGSRLAAASVAASAAGVAASAATRVAPQPGDAGAPAHARQWPGRPLEALGARGAHGAHEAQPAQPAHPAHPAHAAAVQPQNHEQTVAVAPHPRASPAALVPSPVAGEAEPAPVSALADAPGEAADLSAPPPLYPVHWPAARRVAYAGHHGRRPVQAELHWRPDLSGGALASYHLALLLAAAPASPGLAAAASPATHGAADAALPAVGTSTTVPAAPMAPMAHHATTAATAAAPAAATPPARPTATTPGSPTAAQIAGPFLLQQQSHGQLPSHGLAPERLLDRRQGRGARAVNLRWPVASARVEPGSARGAAGPQAAAPVRPEAGPTPDRSPVPSPDAGLWGTGELSFSASTARWPAWPGTQDRLSWLLQLAAVAHAAALAGTPPLPWVELLVADASGGIARWRLVHQGEVLQPLPGGTRRLQHWRHSPAQPDGLWVEAWLDPAQGHWPAGWRYHWPRTGARLALWQTSPNPP